MPFNSLSHAFGESLQCKEKIKRNKSIIRVKVSEVKKKFEYVGIYRPDVGDTLELLFESELIRFYEKFTKANPGKFEIVLHAGWYEGERNFNEAYARLPSTCLAVPFSAYAKRCEMSRKLGVSHIPALFIMRTADAKLITRHGRDAILADPEGKNFPWAKPPDTCD